MQWRLKSPFWVYVGLAEISAIVTVTLWREPHADREQAAASPTDAGPVAIAVAPAAPTSPAAPPAAAAPLARAAVVTQNTNITEHERWNDPEYRKGRLAMLRSTIVRNYPGLADELKLSGDEADRLFDLLAGSQMDLTTQAALFTRDQQEDQAATAEFIRNRQDMQRQQADSLRALLGNARYAEWMDYQQTRSVRLQSVNYAAALAQAGSPLDDAQLKTVTTAVVGEQKNLQQNILALGSRVDVTNPQTQVQAQEALRRRQAESNQRILDVVAPYLSGQQQRLLRAELEQQLVIDRAVADSRVRAKNARLQQQPAP